ncbi:Cobalt-precorrin-6A reductase [bioreactor metagenome]|uniref:Cobalt-precorrin-6A reductase n=1 Tax=bioreactor metagenome TaxID=1076179 RepID=A0A644ZA97_9ZZZZ
MIGLILGTSEGKLILSMLNRYTEDILVSTSSSYGGSLLKDYKFKYLNDKPLIKEELRALLKEKGVQTLIDGSHPYAKEITKNALEVCKELNITYIRYERPSVTEEFLHYENLYYIEEYSEIPRVVSFKGNILNTTGSRNIKTLINLNLENRIIHRILPTSQVLKECEELLVPVEDIIAMKGPFSKELNKAFIKDYNIEAILLKDSGIEGGTIEKLQAAKECGKKIILIGRPKVEYPVIFGDLNLLEQYILVALF